MFHLRRKPKLQTMNAEPEMVPRKTSGEAKQMPTWAKQPLQRSLKVNQPGDRYEQEADQIAEQVMRMPEPGVQRRCACGGAAGPDGECAACRAQRLMLQRQEMLEEEEEVGALQRKTAHAGETAGDAPNSVHQTLNHSGQPLDSRTRAYMEPRFGQDFSDVRVHTDSQAAQSAADVNARAYTVGNNIVFGAGQYQPGSSTRLIAHELAHTVQQAIPPGNNGTLRDNATTQAPTTVMRDYMVADSSPSGGGGRPPSGLTGCHVFLGGRRIDHWLAGNLGFRHLYIDVFKSSTDYALIEGGPTGTSTGGTSGAWVKPMDWDARGIQWDITPDNCETFIECLKRKTAAYHAAAHPYHYSDGPNSNSFVSWCLDQCGLSISPLVSSYPYLGIDYWKTHSRPTPTPAPATP